MIGTFTFGIWILISPMHNVTFLMNKLFLFFKIRSGMTQTHFAPSGIFDKFSQQQKRLSLARDLPGKTGRKTICVIISTVTHCSCKLVKSAQVDINTVWCAACAGPNGLQIESGWQNEEHGVQTAASWGKNKSQQCSCFCTDFQLQWIVASYSWKLPAVIRLLLHYFSCLFLSVTHVKSLY